MRAAPSLALLLASTLATAADDADLAPCKSNQTVSECQRAVTAALAADATKDTESKADKATSGATQGKAFSPALTTFAKIITGGVDFVSVRSTDKAITLESPSFGSSAVRGKARLQVNSPILFDKVPASIKDATLKATATTNLTSDLKDLDDVEAALSIGVRPDRSSLLSTLLVATTDASISKAEFDLARKSLALLPSGADIDTETLKLSDERIKNPSALVKSFRADQKAIVDLGIAYAKAQKDTFDLFATYLANDSQFVFDASYRSRSELVGRDTFSGKATYELGLLSLVSFLKTGGAKKDCPGPRVAAANGDAAARCLGAFATWAKSHTTLLAYSPRVAASVEYSSSRPYELAIADYGVAISLPNAHSITWSVSGSANLDGGGAESRLRLDLGAKYEDASGDATKRDRLIGHLTLAVRVSESIQVPIGIVYANHSEYRDGIDRTWGAHFGLTFRQ